MNKPQLDCTCQGDGVHFAFEAINPLCPVHGDPRDTSLDLWESYDRALRQPTLEKKPAFVTRDPWEDFDRKALVGLETMQKCRKATDAAARRELRDIFCFVAGGFFVAVVILGLEVIGK